MLLAGTPKAYTCSGQSECPHLRLRQTERDVPAAPIRTRDLPSRLTGQRRILTHFGASHLHTPASRDITSKAVFFQYNISSPLLCLWPSCHSLLGSTTSHFKLLLTFEARIHCIGGPVFELSVFYEHQGSPFAKISRGLKTWPP